MATKSQTNSFAGLFTDTRSAESVRRQLIEAPLEVAIPASIVPALEAATLLSKLPKIFLDSQRRELKRIKKTAADNDPRVAQLEASIQQAAGIHDLAGVAQTRVERTVGAVGGKERIFHGFVSDSDLAPLAGLTVRLNGRKTAGRKSLSATTDADGYFNMTLGKKTEKELDTKSRAEQRTVTQRLMEMLSQIERGAARVYTVDEQTEIGEVEILKRGKLLHQDPVALASNQGSIYREYVISGDEPMDPKQRESVVSEAVSQASEGATTTNAGAANLQKPGFTATKAASAKPARKRTAAKKPASKKSASKKGSQKRSKK